MRSLFKTIFGKQFAAFICTLLICFVILGIALSSVFNKFLMEQKLDIIEKQARRITDVTNNPYWEYLNDYVIGPETEFVINKLLIDMQNYLDVSLIVTDKDLNARKASTNIMKYITQYEIDVKALKPVLDGEVVRIYGGTLNGILQEDSLTVACPIVINGEVQGSIIVNTSMEEINANMKDIFGLTLVCLVIAAGISSVLIYITSKTISKPMHEINEAAKIIADGNFEKRLEVQSRDEVGQLACSFNNMAESLDKQEKYRREFIANISHDLRSPLTSIKGFLQAMLDGTIPTEKSERYLNIILDETERLSKLANDVLDLSYIESSEIELNITNFDLNELIRKTLLMFEARITSKEIEMSVLFAEEKTIVPADLEKIKRVLYNLIDNAVKFTDRCGKINIDTSIKNNKVTVSVKDNGKGISIEEQKRIFERFYKVDTSRGEDKKGSGLGLAIVREFINAHGENIKIISDIDKGCEFIFELKVVSEYVQK